MSEKALKAEDVMLGLRKRYVAPEWALFFNVANGTGVRRYRYADAVGMSLFPSRGLEIHGFEIKVSKTDYRREAADPDKAETIAAYCDRWWVVTPDRLLDNENVPPNWGWLAYDGKVFTIKQKAEKTEAKQLDRPFLAAVLRRADEANAGIIARQLEEKTAGIEEEIKRRVEQELEWRTKSHETLKKSVEEFEAAAGIKITAGWRGEDIGKAVRIVEACGVTSLHNGPHHLAKQLRTSAEIIERALAEAGLQHQPV